MFIFYKLLLSLRGKIMGICPYCKQNLDIKDIIIEKRGKGIGGQERMYMCPFCNYILGFSNAIR